MSTRYSLNFRQPGIRRGLRGAPPPTLPLWWLSSTTASFDFSAGSIPSSPATQSSPSLPELHQAQAEMVGGARRFHVAACGRQIGTTTMGLVLALQAAAERGQAVGWFSPTYKYLDAAWRSLRGLAGASTSEELEQAPPRPVPP